MCGGSTPTALTIGTVAIPEMKKRGYANTLTAGTLAAGGTLGILIPPSIPMILYCMVTEQSIGKLFIAGILPGIMLSVLFMAIIYIISQRNPLMGPRGSRTTIIDKMKALQGTWGAFILFLLVMGGIYGGIFTSTEAGAIGAFGALVFALDKKRLNWRNFLASLIETGKTTAMIYFIVIGAWIFGYFMTISRLPFVVTEFVAGLALPRLAILICILIIYAILGCLMEIISMMILTMPLVFPVITSLGFDPVWFGVIMVIMIEMGEITPPVGINVFVISGIARDVPMAITFRGITPFVVGMVACIAILIAFPQIALFLPSAMK